MTLDRRQFLSSGMAILAMPLSPRAWSPPHAALYLYTRPAFRPRHAGIVQRALEQRAAEHTSGWQKRNGKPVLAVGPVNRNAGFWHGDRLVKNIPRTWPFVAVFEYQGRGQPEAHIDWFRRARGNRSPGAWFLDPGIDYVDHINREMVNQHGARWSYMAVPDTPTGGYVGTAEFAIRARVRWADGRRAQSGWWLWFDAPKGRSVDDWQVVQTPLVDWLVTKSTPRLGAVETAAVDDPDRELAVWGTNTVFQFPEMPEGLTAGRGRD